MGYKGKRVIKSTAIYIIIIVSMTLVYLPGIPNSQFVLDDLPLVKDNQYIRELHPFYSYFLQEDGITSEDVAGEYHTGYYRPFINITYFVDFKIWGMEAAGFRITNLILHLVTCLLLFNMLSGYYERRMIPLLVTLLFGLHPVNTEAVSWISARNNILVSIFSLASFHFFVRQEKKNSGINLILSIFFFGMALLSKEFGVVLLFVFFLYKRLLANSEQPWSNEIKQYLPYLVVLLSYFWVRWIAIGSILSPADEGNILQRILLAPYLILYNLRLIFIPFNIHLFSIRYPEEIFGREAMIGWVGLVLIGFLLWRYRKDRMILFSFMAFIAGIFPVLNIIQTSAGSLVSARWLYFPLMFLMMSISRGLEKLFKLRRLLVACAMVILTIYLGVYSLLLNRCQWHDEWSLFHREVIQYGNLAYAGGFAEQYHRKDDYLLANKYYVMAIHAFPEDSKNRIGYAALMLDLRRPHKALFHLKKAEGMGMTSRTRSDLFNNKGLAYLQLGRVQKAIFLMERAVGLAPHKVEFWENLGAAYGYAGDYDKSVSVLKKGRDICGDSVNLNRNLAISYMRLGSYNEAISILERLLKQETGEKRMKIEKLLKRAYRQKNRGLVDKDLGKGLNPFHFNQN